MPFVETTMIAGYGPDVKARLVTAFTRSVRSVMNAPLDGVIVVLREVEPTNWARGGVSRVPGPPIPYALDVARAYLAAGEDERRALSEPEAPSSVAPTGFADWTLAEAYTDDGSLVFAERADAAGARSLVRLHVRLGKIAGVSVWSGAG